MATKSTKSKPTIGNLTKKRFGFTHSRFIIFALIFANIGVGTLLLSSAATVAPNPAKNIPEYPYAWGTCNDSSVTCLQKAIADLNHARNVMGLPNYTLPANFYDLSEQDQVFILINLDRASYHMPPFVGVNKTLNAYAQKGVATGTDPPFPSTVDGYNNYYGEANWAGTFGNMLLAYYEMMYDDGLGGTNGDCYTGHTQWCWGHRSNFLTNYGSGWTGYIGIAAGVKSGDSSESYAMLMTGFSSTDKISYATIPNQSAIGSLDSITRVSGGLRFSGWALDYDAGKAPITVYIFAGATNLGGVTANGSRPDVGAAFPGYGSNHGFTVTYPFGHGTVTFCAKAMNFPANTGGNTNLCKTVTV